MNKWLIYMIVLKSSYKPLYIGQIQDLNKRFVAHLWNAFCGEHKNELYKFMKNYNWDDFDVVILEDNIFDQNTANMRERYWIDKYNTHRCGHNDNAGGSGSSNFSISEERLITKLYLNGAGINTLSMTYGCQERTIRNILKRNGVMMSQYYNYIGCDYVPFYYTTAPFRYSY